MEESAGEKLSSESGRSTQLLFASLSLLILTEQRGRRNKTVDIKRLVITKSENEEKQLDQERRTRTKRDKRERANERTDYGNAEGQKGVGYWI